MSLSVVIRIGHLRRAGRCFHRCSGNLPVSERAMVPGQSAEVHHEPLSELCRSITNGD